MSASSSVIPEPPPEDPTPPITLILTVLLLTMFIAGFFSIYCCRCFIETLANSLNRRQDPGGAPVEPLAAPVGLDLSIVNSFPTFTYSSVKDYRRDKYGLECAICLCEFDDSDMLRLLTICCHVFHQECIDLWFESHKSCPVCRRNLDEAEAKESPEDISNTDNVPVNVTNNNLNRSDGNALDASDSVSITIKDDTEGHEIELEIKGDSSLNNGIEKNEEHDHNYSKFSRSHSTGHIEDKYKLRLPKHIEETITRRHIATVSCTTFGEYSSNPAEKHQWFGEIWGRATFGDANRV